MKIFIEIFTKAVSVSPIAAIANLNPVRTGKLYFYFLYLVFLTKLSDPQWILRPLKDRHFDFKRITKLFTRYKIF